MGFCLVPAESQLACVSLRSLRQKNPDEYARFFDMAKAIELSCCIRFSHYSLVFQPFRQILTFLALSKSHFFLHFFCCLEVNTLQAIEYE